MNFASLASVPGSVSGMPLDVDSTLVVPGSLLLGVLVVREDDTLLFVVSGPGPGSGVDELSLGWAFEVVGPWAVAVEVEISTAGKRGITDVGACFCEGVLVAEQALRPNNAKASPALFLQGRQLVSEAGGARVELR